MKEKILVIILLIAVISGCTDSRVNGLYVNEKDHNLTLKFLDDGKVLDTGKNGNAAMLDSKIDGDIVILTWLGMSYIFKIQDNGKTLVSPEGDIYRKVDS